MTSTIRRNPIVRAVAVLALALGLFAAVPAPSGAAEACVPGDYGNTAQLTANPPTITPGGTVTIGGSGFPGDCILGITVGSCAVADEIGTVTTDPDGNFEITWQVPDDQAPGDVLVCTTMGTVQVTANVTVASPTTTTLAPATGGTGGSGTLPATGSQVLPFVAGGVLLLVVGSLLVLSTRKRNAAR